MYVITNVLTMYVITNVLTMYVITNVLTMLLFYGCQWPTNEVIWKSFEKN
jgi:hypothetical protein